jgi:hypothetical protein
MADQVDLAAQPTPLSDADRLTPYGLSVRYGTAAPGNVDRDTALGWATAAVSWATAVIGSDRD